jgi:hypothetical protein
MSYGTKITLWCVLAALAALFSNCQTFDGGYGPGNSPNSLLVVIDKGVVELKVYRKIIKNIERLDDDNERKRDTSAGGIVEAVVDAFWEEPKAIKLTAGAEYSCYINRNETVTLSMRRVKDGEHDVPAEVTIKYRSKEKKYTLKTNAVSKSYSYTGG